MRTFSLIAGGLFLAAFVPMAPATIVSVPANAGPWLLNGVNSGFTYGDGAQANPAVVDASSGINFLPAVQLTVTYVSGLVSTNPTEVPGNDANGLGDSGAPNNSFPAFYATDAGDSLFMELVGTFADANGSIVGTPFLLGNGPTNISIPAGTTQLDLGVDDNQFADNVDANGAPLGAWSISVVVAPEPALLGLMPIAGMTLVRRRQMRP